MLITADELAEHRADAEARMLDQCRIEYPTGRMVQDETTGREVPQYATRFTTRCRVKAGTMAIAEGGGRELVTLRRELHIPVSSPATFDGDRAVMTFVHPTTDPTLAGAVLTLGAVAVGSQTTARRIDVEEVAT